MKRLRPVRALFGFLRRQRHVIFDDAFQEQLEGFIETRAQVTSRTLRRCSAWRF